MTVSLERGDGAVAWLLRDPAGRELLQHLDEISGKLARGDGTLGALLTDSTIYDDLALLLEGAERSRLARRGIRHEIESGRKARKERANGEPSLTTSDRAPGSRQRDR